MMKKHVWKILAIALMMALLLPTVNLGSTATAAGPEGKQTVKITSKTDNVAFKVQPQLREAASAAASDEEIQVVLHVRAGTDVSRYMTWSLTRPFVGPAGEQAVIGGVLAGNLAKLASVDGVSTIRLAENPFAPPKPIEDRQPVNANKIQQRLASTRANYSAVEGIPDRSGDVSITGWFDVLDNHKSAAAWANGFTGNGVKAMVNDSGVDFCHPDLQGTWAVISDSTSPYDGWPEMFDSRSVYFWALASYLGDTGVADGLTDYADTSATCTSGADCLYQPIGATEAHTYTLPATSQSGTYHIGSHPDKALQNWWYGERVAILVVDENTAGVYDTVYVDLNDNYDFTDDPTATKASPTACADMDGDGYADVSGGLVYFIADGVNPIPTADWMYGLGVAGNDAQDFGEPDNGSLVAFSLNDTTFTDHGQLVASNIVAQGVINGGAPSYKPAGDGTPGTGLVLGAGKDVGLTSNGDFYQSFFVEDGFIFSALGYDGVPGTADDIQAINNSWGTSSTDNDGWDEESRLIDHYQSLNPSLSVLVATGNGAPGFGTVTSPNPPSGIGVGASTEMGSTGWDSATTADQITHGDMAPWSDRGPGARGDVGVHVVADGSYASGDLALNEIGDGWNAWETWGGTSRACPVAVGNLALVYDAYKQTNGVWPTATEARNILMSGADNINYDVLIQGAGRVNADRATQIAAGMGPGMATPESWQVGDYRGTEYPGFANIIHPGQSDTQTFTLQVPGSTADQTFNIQSDILRKVSEQTFDWTTADMAQEDAYSFNRPGYLRNLTPDIPAGTDLMVVRVIYPYNEWDIDGDYVQDQYWRVVLYDWTDVSGDGALWTDTNGNGTVNGAELEDGEYMRFAYLHSSANNRTVYVQNPLGRMHDGVFLGLQHAGTDARVPVSHLKVRVEYYQHQAWDWLTPSASSITVPAGSSATFDATVNVPASAGYGVYDGAIMVSPATVSAASGTASMEDTIVVPVIVNVAAFSTDFSFGGASSGDTLYDNARVFGTQDWRWRAESGDWRFFFTDVPDSTPAGTNFLVKTSWQNGPHTDIDTIIMGPEQDCYSNGVGCRFGGDPAYYGPYTLGVVGKSPNTNIHDGTWTFDTSTGGPQDWVSAPANPGLNLIALHNVNFEGSDFSENFAGQVGTITANPNTINIVTASDAGSFDIQVSSSMGLPDYSTDGFGLGVPQVYTNQPIQQDDPNDPTTASYTKTVTLNHAGLLDITTGNTSGSDIDLYLYYDSNNDGTFDKSMGSSTTSSDAEQITLQFPADGDYMIAVHGWSVAGGADTFDLTINAVQGTDITAAAAPTGPFGPNTPVTLHYTYNLATMGTSSVAPGETASGMITLGPSTAPGALEIPVTISRVGSLNYSFQQGDDNGYSGTTDTWINAWATGASYGSTSGLQVRQNNVMSGLIRFDTSSLPAGWTVTSAKLKVYSHYASGLPTQITAYKMSKAWDPTTATWLAANASTNWTGPGATGTDDRASTAVASFTADAPGWYTIDVTSAVQDWINDPSSNFGLILVGSGDVSSRHDFRSSDWMVQSERPILEVNFGS